MGDAGEKRGRGRPRVRPLKPVQIRCELSPEEHAEAERAAELLGESLSAFARQAVRERSRKTLGPAKPKPVPSPNPPPSGPRPTRRRKTP